MPLSMAQVRASAMLAGDFPLSRARIIHTCWRVMLPLGLNVVAVVPLT